MWQDTATQMLGPLAPDVIQRLQSVNPNYDWSKVIQQYVPALNSAYGTDWMDPSRGSSAGIVSALIQNAQNDGQTWAASALPQAQQAQHQQEAQILKAQNPPDKGGFGGLGLFGTIAGLVGAAYGMPEFLSGMSGTAGVGEAALAGDSIAGSVGAAGGSASTIADVPWGVNQQTYTGSGSVDFADPSLTDPSGYSKQVGYNGDPTIGGNGYGMNPSQVGSNLLGGISPLTALGAGNAIAGLVGAGAASKAGQLQADAANNSVATQERMFNTINGQQAPYREAGAKALNTIDALAPQFMHSFDANDLKTNLAPNYQFQLDQGLGAVRNAGNLQTGLISGNTLKGINDYAQNYAGNAYQNAFNNYNANQTNIFNRLSNIAGLGQTANANVAGPSAQLATGIGNAQTNVGASQAAGLVGSTNALTGGANSALGWYTLPQVVRSLNG